MYLLGIGVGCLVAGPLSETKGRNPVYLVATFCYLFFVLGCALTKTFGGQIACRFFTGFYASGTLGINGASVRDQFRPVKRSFVFPVIAWANVACKAFGVVSEQLLICEQRLFLLLWQAAGLCQIQAWVGDGVIGLHSSYPHSPSLSLSSFYQRRTFLYYSTGKQNI